MRYSNIHAHTVYSDGRNTVDEMVAAAVANNMISIGISDHSPSMSFDSTYCVNPAKLPAYFADLRAAREKYKGQIEVYIGLEWECYADLENRADYDYLIGDTHYVLTDTGYHPVDHSAPMQDKCISECFSGDTLAYALAYYDGYEALIRKNHPDVLGHFDLCTKYGKMPEDDPRYIARALEVLDSCLEVCPLIELNTGAKARGCREIPYPAPILLKRCLEKGAKIVFGSDSHRTEHLIYAFDDSVELLKSTGFKSITLLKNGHWEEMGI